MIPSIFLGIVFAVITVDQKIFGAIVEDNVEEEHGEETGRHAWGLVIIPHVGHQSNMLMRQVDDTLNLTCMIEHHETDEENITEHYYDQMFKLSWYLPFVLDNTKNRVTNIDSRNRNSLQLVVNHLKETDSGNYTCQAEALTDSLYFNPSTEYVEVRVKQREGTCAETQFSCTSGECIGRILLCDGRADCKDRSDESPEQCGSWNRNLCEGKLRCEDGRCFSKHWCCDRQVDRNCTMRNTPKCCLQLQTLNMDVNQYSPQPQHYNDMGFLQTTIYTVIGCAMAFMFIITIMVIAICRVHLKRTANARYPHHQSQAAQRHDSWTNIFLQSGGGLPYTSAASGLLVTYNINNGVQFVGRPVKPPPYSEILRVPQREGPPPPYASFENISGIAKSPTASQFQESALTHHNYPETTASRLSRDHFRESDPDELDTLEPLLSNNNNGDINGNNMEDVLVQPNWNSQHEEGIVTTASESSTSTMMPTSGSRLSIHMSDT